VRGDGKVVTQTTGAAEAQSIEIEFADGRITLPGGTKPDQDRLL